MPIFISSHIPGPGEEAVVTAVKVLLSLSGFGWVQASRQVADLARLLVSAVVGLLAASGWAW